MPEPQDFINQSRAVGKSDQAIFQELKAVGWTDQQLQDYFPNLITSSAAPVAQHEQSTANAQLASKRWPMIIGISVLVVLMAAAGYAVYQYWMEQQAEPEPLSPVPEPAAASPSAELNNLVTQQAATMGVVVYSFLDETLDQIKVMSLDLNASTSAELYALSASESAELTAGNWSPDGRYLPVTIAASQPQALFVDKYTNQVAHHQAELSNPWEIIPGFVAYWSSGTTAVITEHAASQADQLTRTEISLAGQVITSDVDQRVKYGNEQFTLDYGQVGSRSADLILTSQSVPVILIKDAPFKALPDLLPVGMINDQVFFYKIEKSAQSETARSELQDVEQNFTSDPSQNSELTDSAITQSSAVDATIDMSDQNISSDQTSISSNSQQLLALASDPAATSGAVLGVTNPTGLETHLLIYDAVQGTQLSDEVVSTPGWFTSKVIVHPTTGQLYILEYQELDASGNGLVQLKKLASVNEASQATDQPPEQATASATAEGPEFPATADESAIITFPAKISNFDVPFSNPGQFEFTADGNWFVYRMLDNQTGTTQLRAFNLNSAAEVPVCVTNCGFISTYNPMTPNHR